MEMPRAVVERGMERCRVAGAVVESREMRKEVVAVVGVVLLIMVAGLGMVVVPREKRRRVKHGAQMKRLVVMLSPRVPVEVVAPLLHVRDRVFQVEPHVLVPHANQLHMARCNDEQVGVLRALHE